MTETRTEVKPIKINICCDECSKKPNPGCVLKNTGDVYLTYPSRYIYKCPICEKIFKLDKHYPRIEYEEVE